MKTVLSLMLAALLVSTGVAAPQAQQQKPAPASGLEKALIGTWNGSWTGGSGGTVTFTFVRGTDGKLGGSAAPQPNDGQGYTTNFTSVVVADDKVTMKMLTPDGGAEITVQATVAGADMKGTYAVKGGDGSEVESGTIVAKKKA
ncbi:MAG TPA: hypothetical protein VFO19_14995 [Vicinamibacterales bacterium]|nr:hypothetical protein [Vicinamibacterales bacterium]